MNSRDFQDKIIEQVVQHLLDHPQEDEDEFMIKFTQGLTREVEVLQEERRALYDKIRDGLYQRSATNPSLILVTDKQNISAAIKRAGEDFNQGKVRYPVQRFDTSTIYNIIVDSIKYDSRFEVIHGAIYVKRKSEKPFMGSPFTNYYFEILQNIKNHYMNDNYLDSKAMCLSDCYDSFVSHALHMSEISKTFENDWQYGIYAEDCSDTDSRSDSHSDSDSDSDTDK